MAKKSAGRPRLENSPKRAPLNMKTTPELRDRIQEAADNSGRPLTQEVEHRLQQSFYDDDAFGGPSRSSLVRMIGILVAAEERRSGKSITEDFYTWNAAKAAINGVIDKIKPPVTEDLAAKHTELLTQLQSGAKQEERSESKRLKRPLYDFELADIARRHLANAESQLFILDDELSKHIQIAARAGAPLTSAWEIASNGEE